MGAGRRGTPPRRKRARALARSKPQRTLVCHVQWAAVAFTTCSSPWPYVAMRNADTGVCASHFVASPSRLPPSPMVMYTGPFESRLLLYARWLRSLLFARV